MANISLTNYDAQLADAQRRQKMAEMLQEQANAPFDIQSYKGVQAPIPFTAVLAKALQGGLAGYQGRKADEQKAALSEQTRKGLAEYLQQSSPNYQIPNIQTLPPMRTEQVQGPMAQPVGLQTPQQLTAGGMQGMAARGNAPMAMPPTGAMVPPAPALVRPQTISVPDMTPQPAMINRPAVDRQQMVLQGIASDNPLIRQIAPSMYDQATKDVDRETMVNAIKKIKVEGTDAEMLGAYMASPDPSKALDYLVSVGNSRAEAAATLEQIKETAAASAQQRQLDRELRLYQGDQASLDRRSIAAQSSADRMAMYQMMMKNRLGPRMPTRVQDDLVHKAGLADSADRAFSNFNDRFVGHAFTGETGVFFNRLTGKDPDAANWWQDYKNYQADVIHDRYGGALTTNEVTRYKQYAVTPQMDAKVAKTNLDQQNKIIKTALGRKAQGSLALGYDRETVSALIGRDPTNLSVAPPSSPQGNATLIYDPKTGSLVPKK